MKRVCMLFVMLLALGSAAHAQIKMLHEFAGEPGDGANPMLSQLIQSGSTLYGMTGSGGSNNAGVIFKINTDGSSFQFLHEFAGGNDDGAAPSGSLILSGSTLYGMTVAGGDSDQGVIFKINTDGSSFQLLHEFVSGNDDGAAPQGSLFLIGSALYGMTFAGGDTDAGVIFKIDTDGNGFQLLHEFAGGSDDGAAPYGSLILIGSTLYGMTSAGGDDDLGVIFKMETNGSGFQLLHEFAFVPNDGAIPFGSPVSSGSTLYGMTYLGGGTGLGTIFKINSDGSGFQLLHEFADGLNDGAFPYGSLALSQSTLYGMTFAGGTAGTGVLFKINTDGNGFNVLHGFAGGADDGSMPLGSLIFIDLTLYGMTNAGGDSDWGVIFSFPLWSPPVPALSLPGMILFAVLLLGVTLRFISRKRRPA
jgi:uncharacterized repeat protein (TIGR03803 family)